MVDSPVHPLSSFRIFICYRREDAAAYAGRIYDALVARYGADGVFLDVDTIPAGTDFTQALDAALENCRAVLAIIGRDWLAVVDPDGRRRLDDPNDYVRREIETALQRNLVVIPLLVHDTTMPTGNELPAGLQRLANRQAIELHDQGWSEGVQFLLRELDRHRDNQPSDRRDADTPTTAPRSTPAPNRRWVLVLGLIAVAVATVLVIPRPGSAPTATPPPIEPASVATVPVGQQPQGVALSPNGHQLYVANSSSGTVSVLDTANATVTVTVTVTLAVAASPVNIAFSPDGSRVYVTDYKSAALVVLDAATGAIVGRPIPVQDGPWGVALTPDGRRAYVTNCGASSVSVVDTTAGAVLGKPIAVGTCPLGVGVAPDGRRVFVANAYSNSISVIDTSTEMVTGAPIAVGTRPHSLVFSADGLHAYVANNGELYTSGPGPGSVSVIDTRNDTASAPIPVGSGPWGLALSPDGSRLYTGDSASGTVSTLDTVNRSVTRPPVTVGGIPTGVAVSPDGRRIFVADSRGASVSVIHL